MASVSWVFVDGDNPFSCCVSCRLPGRPRGRKCDCRALSPKFNAQVEESVIRVFHKDVLYLGKYVKASVSVVSDLSIVVPDCRHIGL